MSAVMQQYARADMDAVKEFERELHYIITFLPVSILAGFLYVAHSIVTKTGENKMQAIELVAGWFLAAGVAWAATWLLQSINIDPNLANPIAAIFGASGEKGYTLLLKRFQLILGIRENAQNEDNPNP